MIEESNVKLVTSIPGPKSIEILEERKKYVADGVSVSTGIAISEAKGALIKDVDGNVFLDFAAGIGVQNVGHCDPEIVEEIKKQTELFIHPSYNVITYESYGALAKN